ncbi:MAG: diguanylate cyclase [Actinobacteria bacterium]|nr:diguanylate cyclase [Actinomycetota bacterium]
MEQISLDVAPLITHPKETCNECWGCVRACPVRAIRVVAGHSEVVQDKCVACGLCVTECGRDGHVVRDDTPAVREILRSRRPVVALLASEFIAALYPMTVSQIERGLEMLGFAAIETTLLGEELVAEAYEKLHLRDDILLSMRSTCPVAVNFVRKYFPSLVPALAPIVPPYIAQAKLIREVYAEDVAIVYVSPCFARKDEFRDPQFGGAVNVAIDFTELKRMFDEGADTNQVHRSAVRNSRPSALKEISLTDGFPRQTLVKRNLTDVSVEVARGLDEVDRLLRALMAGEAGPSIIDMLNCEGCLDGPAVSSGLSVFAKRSIEASAREHPGTTHVSTRAMLGVLPSIDSIRSFNAAPVYTPTPTDAQIDEILESGRLTRQTAPDCGACGWTTCVEHAAAVFNAESSWDLCLPLQRALFEEQASVLDAHRDALAESRTLDPGTGLWNKRTFADRLDLELSRHLRYGSSLAVVLLDIDGFGAVNDVAGREGGDLALQLVAERISTSLRATDFPARWTGDQFAVILPGIGKTAAFAAAEKLREVVGGAAYEIVAGGYTGSVSLTASVGVSAASQAIADAHSLLEAADAALHEAMSTGRNRVHLAPG